MKKIDFDSYRPPAQSYGQAPGPLRSSPPPAGDVTTVLAHLAVRFPEKLTFTIEEAAQLLSVDYETIRRRVAAGVIASISVGRRKLIPIQSLAHILTHGA